MPTGGLVYGLTQYPGGMTIDPNTGAVQWTPTDFGNYPVTIEVQDVMGQSATQSYTIAVAPTPAAMPPVITTVPVTGATFTVPYTQQITAVDPQNETGETQCELPYSRFASRFVSRTKAGLTSSGSKWMLSRLKVSLFSSAAFSD